VRPVSLYLHVPFCVQKCGYCDFNSFAGSKPEEHTAYVAALTREMELWSERPEMRGATVPTVFVGGGTPTLLEADLLASLLTTACRLFAVTSDAEITIEANPGTIDFEGNRLLAAFQAGANRVSFGVQARQPRLLNLLGRIHSPVEVEQAVTAARTAGFVNINLDLMYGLPGQSTADFEETVKWALSLGPTHISAYSLIVEEGTPFYIEHQAGRLHLPPEETEDEMFLSGRELLVQAGFEHYEVSNFARPGYRSQHNQVYWRNAHYLGLGCGAHSFLQLQESIPNVGVNRPRLSASRVQGGAQLATAPGAAGESYRFWSLKLPGAYRQALQSGLLPVEAGESINSDIEMAETMIMGLRLLEGVATERFATRFGAPPEQIYAEQVKRLQALGLMTSSDGALRLTDRGLRIGNQVWQEFLPG